MCLPLEHLVTLYNQYCKYHLSTTDVGIASLCCLDCQRWKKGSAAVCSDQPWLWTELFTQGGLDTCTLKDAVFPTTCPLKLSKVILNLTLMLLLKWNWSSFIVVLCPRLNCCWRLLCSLDLLRYAHPPKSISQACVHVCVFAFFPQVKFSWMSASNNKERDYFDRGSGRLWLEGARPSQSNHGNCTFKLMLSCRQVKKSAVLYNWVWQMSKMGWEKEFRK